MTMNLCVWHQNGTGRGTIHVARYRYLPKLTVLRIRDVYPGSRVKTIPNAGFRIRIHIKELQYF